MRERRKLSFEQDMALVAGRRVARANQRRRMAAKEQAARERQEAEAREAAKAADPARCPECEGTRRHDEFCSRPVELA